MYAASCRSSPPIVRYPDIRRYPDKRRSISLGATTNRELHSSPGMNKAASVYKAVILLSIALVYTTPPPYYNILLYYCICDQLRSC